MGRAGKFDRVGQCPACGSWVSVVSDGTLRLHYANKASRNEYCEPWPNRKRRLPREGSVRERTEEEKKAIQIEGDRARELAVFRSETRWVMHRNMLRRRDADLAGWTKKEE